MKIKTFSGEVIEIQEEDIIAILEGIYTKDVYAEYVGGTLSYNHEHGDGSKHLLAFNVNFHLSDKINYWIAKLYIQNKDPKRKYWEDAERIICNYIERIKE